MDYDINASGEGLQQLAVPQYQDHKPVYKRPWFWIAAAAALILAGGLAILLAPGKAPERYKLTGNAGVVAAYDFFLSQQESQEKLTSPLMKEFGERLKKEPFEIECVASVDLGGMREGSLPISNVGVGIYAKYDLKDLGVRVGAMGVDVISGYIIDDNIVVSYMGKTGGKQVKLPEGTDIKKNMGLGERVKAFLPFLPEEEVYLSLLEKFAGSVPDKYTAEDTAFVYSPKEDKEVLMHVIKTTLGPQELGEAMLSFTGKVKGDKELFGQLQDITNKFTAFAGLEQQDLGKLIEEFESTLDMGDLYPEEKLSWSVYKRNDKYVGISIELFTKKTNIEYTYMSEYEGNDSFLYGVTELNGVRSETKYEYNWNGNKLKMSGEAKSASGTNADGTTMLIEGEAEYSKDGANEYSIACDFTINGSFGSGALDPRGGGDVGMKLDINIALGGGLGTLKEDREWKSIYGKEWGSLDDLFGSFLPGFSGGYFSDYDNGSSFGALS